MRGGRDGKWENLVHENPKAVQKVLSRLGIKTPRPQSLSVVYFIPFFFFILFYHYFSPPSLLLLERVICLSVPAIFKSFYHILFTFLYILLLFIFSLSSFHFTVHPFHLNITLHFISTDSWYFCSSLLFSPFFFSRDNKSSWRWACRRVAVVVVCCCSWSPPFSLFFGRRWCDGF